MGIRIYGNITSDIVRTVRTTTNTVSGIVSQVNQPLSVQNVINSGVLNAFGCPPAPEEPEIIETDEPEAQQEEQIESERRPPSSPEDFLAPVRVIDTPASFVCRTKEVINQSLFIAEGRDVSVINQGVETSLNELTEEDAQAIRSSFREIRYPTDVDEYISIDSYQDMDALRYVLGTYWSVNTNEYGINGQANMHVKFLQNGRSPRNLMFKNIKLMEEGTEFTITMRPDYDFFQPNIPPEEEYGKYEKAILRDFVLGDNIVNTARRYPERYNRPLIDGQTFHDYVHDVRMPLFSKEKENANIGRVLDADITFQVNYISEEFRNNPDDPTSIYNPYRLCQVGDSSVARDGIYYPTRERPQDSTLAYTPKHIEKFAEVKRAYSSLYPVVVNINFATAQGGEFSRILKTQNSTISNLSLKILNMSETEKFAEVMAETIEELEQDQEAEEISMENDMFVQESELGFEDIMSILDSQDLGQRNMSSENFPLFNLSSGEDEPNDVLSSFFARLENAINIAKVREIEHSKSRSMLDIFQGKKAYAEPVAYVVEKYSVDNVGEISEGAPDQTFIFMDNEDVDRIDFIDPQVSYEGEYVYRVSVVNLVIGNEYRYDSFRIGEDNIPEIRTVSAESFYFYEEEDTAYGSPFSDPRGDIVPNQILSQQVEKTARKVFFQLTTSKYKGNASALTMASIRSGIEPETEGTSVLWTTSVGNPSNPKEYEIRAEMANRKRMITEERISSQADLQRNRMTNIQGPVGIARSSRFDTFEIKGTCVPRARLVKVPYFQKTLFIDDHPPLSPDVDVVPYKGIDNRIKLIMTSRVGEEIASPILIEPDDSDLFTNYLSGQDMPVNFTDPRTGESTKPMVKFKSDDPPRLYQVFRTTSAPSSYDDFRGSLLTQVSNFNFSSASSYIDDIEPNVGYYYMFRSIDRGQHVSNPSKVFYVEIISTDDGMYLDWRVFKFPKPDKTHSFSFDKYFAIRASQDQRSPDISGQTPDGDEAFLKPNDLTPGPKGDKIWGRTFIVRVKSKSTGNTFDIKFKCRNVHSDLTPEGLTEGGLAGLIASQLPTGGGTGGSGGGGGGGTGGGGY